VKRRRMIEERSSLVKTPLEEWDSKDKQKFWKHAHKRRLLIVLGISIVAALVLIISIAVALAQKKQQPNQNLVQLLKF